jgi:FKBP-type peptidyl-prolyl cis-trans isomerase FklB
MRSLVAAAALVGLIGCTSATESDVKLATQKDSVSYSIGMSVGKNLTRDSITIDPAAFLRGVMDARADSAHRLMNDVEVQKCIAAFQDSLRKNQEDRARAAGEEQMSTGTAYLAENAKKPGVVTLPSGLQYKVIAEGKGKTPADNSMVTTHYRGRLIDGTEFDSSYKRGQPAQFPVGGVIRGWTEALKLMKEGSKWELYIPPDLAYGSSGAGGVIPPNATLIFEIELLSVGK